MKFVVALATAACLFLAACSPRAGGASAKTADATGTPTAAAAAKTFLDAWDVTAEGTPLGTVDGVLTLTEADGEMGGTFRFQGMTYELTEVTRTDGGVTASFYYPEAGGSVAIALKGAPTADQLGGTTMGQYMTTATRQK